MPYIFHCFLHQFYYGLQVTCFYKAFRHDEGHGFLLACSSCLGIDTVVSTAWCLGTLSLPSSSSIDIVWRGPVSLVLGILWLSGSDIVFHCGIDDVCLGSVMAVLYICLPPYLVWHFTSYSYFSDTRPVAFGPVTVFHWWVSILLVCSPLCYHVRFNGTSLRQSQCWDSCLIKYAGSSNIGNVIFNFK